MRFLRLGIASRSTFKALIEYECFTHNSAARVFSEVEIEGFFHQGGTPPHPGPSIKTWCGLCDVSDLDESGFHEFQYAKSASKDKIKSAHVKGHPYFVYRIPPYINEHPDNDQGSSRDPIQPSDAGVPFCVRTTSNTWHFRHNVEIRPPPPGLTLKDPAAFSQICQKRLQSHTTFGLARRKVQPATTLSPNHVEPTRHNPPTTSIPARPSTSIRQTPEAHSNIQQPDGALQKQLEDLKAQVSKLQEDKTALQTRNTNLQADLESSHADAKRAKASYKAIVERHAPSLNKAQSSLTSLMPFTGGKLSSQHAFMSLPGITPSSVKVLPAVSTPTEVYSALKIRVDPFTGQPIPSQVCNTTFPAKLGDLEDRRMRDLMKCVHYPLSQILSAIHHQPRELLTLYIEHLQRHGQSAATALEGLQLEAMPGMRKLFADYNSATIRADKMQILSVLTRFFTFKDMQGLPLVPRVTKRNFEAATAHAVSWGSACTARDPPIQKTIFPVAMLKELTGWLMNPELIHNVAFGTKPLTLSDGIQFEIPAIQRKQIRSEMFEEFQAQHTDNDGNYTGRSRSIFFMAASLGSASDQKSLAALDNHAVRYGTDFKQLRKLARDLVSWKGLASSIGDSLLKMVDDIESFMKYELEQHLQPSSPCASHCCTFALGGMGETLSNKCPTSCGDHSHTCSKCNQLDLLFLNLEDMLGPMARLPTHCHPPR